MLDLDAVEITGLVGKVPEVTEGPQKASAFRPGMNAVPVRGWSAARRDIPERETRTCMRQAGRRCCSM
ncbi:hypothetical protein GCM10014719_48890 [Planomonospora parontospora subsp. antibiotica]|nr:hypothetical protein GCM10014719_48890 [Planomonospora parontospora subsp. antibiotica]GII18294.1 hypothetical protein Ppa05_50200 [Planomonospora parontospora subsp. antibiotica]